MRRGRRPLPYQLSQRIKTYHRIGLGIRSIKNRTGCCLVTIRKVLADQKAESVTLDKAVLCGGCGSYVKQLPCVLCSVRQSQKV
jgi:deoxycytidylate deaminase